MISGFNLSSSCLTFEPALMRFIFATLAFYLTKNSENKLETGSKELLTSHARHAHQRVEWMVP